MSVDLAEYPQYIEPVNATHYYIGVFAQVTSLLTDIVQGTLSGFDVTSLFQNNNDYISNIRMYPFEVDKIWYRNINPMTNFYLGKKIIDGNDYSLYKINAVGYPPVKKWFTFTLTRTFNNFLDFEPYTKIKLYVPLFDTINLPLELCYGYEIESYISLDVRTGDMTLSLFRKDDGLQIYTQTKNVAIEIPVGASNEQEQQRNRLLNGISFTGSLVGAGVGIASGKPLITAGSVGALTKTTVNALQNEVDRFSLNGGVKGSSSTYMNSKEILLITEQPQNILYPSSSLKGKPLRDNKVLSTITGYTEVGEINFNPSNYDIYDDEIREIEELLKSGVIL